MRSRALLTALLVGVFALEGSTAQSLGEIARQEEERRKQTLPGKAYTNDDLRPEPKPSAPAAQPSAGAVMSSADAAKPSPTDPASASQSSGLTPPARGREKRDETYWRTRARELRGRFQQAHAEIALVEARLTELDAQSGASPTAASERAVTATALRKLRQNVQFFSAELTRFEERARADNIPIDWIK